MGSKPSHKVRARTKVKPYKIKTVKAARKRFKVTATEQVLFRPAGHRHLMSEKSGAKRRGQRRWRSFLAAHDQKDVLRLMQGER